MKQKKHRLVIQIGLMAGVMFLIAIAINTLLISRRNTQMYLSTRDEMSIQDAVRISDDLSRLNGLGILLDCWERHADEMPFETTDEDYDIYYDKLDGRDGKESISTEVMRGLSEKELLSVLRVISQQMPIFFDRSYCKFQYESIQLIDIRNPEEDAAVCFDREGRAVFRRGLLLQPELKERYLSGDDLSTAFEIVDTEAGRYYNAFQPVFSEGEMVAVLNLQYNWEESAPYLRQQIRETVIQTVVALGIVLGLVLFAIYLMAVRPLSKITNSGRVYVRDKNTEMIRKRLSEVRARNEFGVLADDVTELAVEMERYTQENIQLTKERERVSAELELATSIQSNMLPNLFPAFPERSEFDIVASMDPAKEVGGDFYDFFLLDENHLGMVIADVSGKGVPAALFMMMCKIVISNYAATSLSPKTVLELANDAICQHNKDKMFVTVWFGVLDIPSGTVTAANAGHEYPVIRHADGRFELMKDRHGFVLGTKIVKKYTEYSFRLEKGASLFLYTDGLPEATNAKNELFGTERMLEALNSEPGAEPEKLLSNVSEAVWKFVGDAPQFDDLTMLALRIAEDGGGKSKMKEVTLDQLIRMTAQDPDMKAKFGSLDLRTMSGYDDDFMKAEEIAMSLGMTIVHDEQLSLDDMAGVSGAGEALPPADEKPQN